MLARVPQPPTPTPGTFPTIAGVGVGVDEACIKYLLRKSLDELLCDLGRERDQPRSPVLRAHTRPSHTHTLMHTALTSFAARPMHLMACMSLTLQPSQNSAVSTRWERASG